MISVNTITNANVYVNGSNLAGCIAEFKIPEISMMMVEHKALGMFGKMEIPTGLDKMEGSVKWNSIYPDAFSQILNPFSAIQLQVRGSIDTIVPGQGRTAQEPCIMFLTAMFKKLNGIGFKPHENVDVETSYVATALKMTVSEGDLLEIDVLANVYKINGVDQLATYRANLGF